MKTSTHLVNGASVPASRRTHSIARSNRALDFLALTKPRLNLLVLITTLAGLYLASPDGVAVALATHTLIGTALVAGGAAALNQVWERETDRRMRRTSGRPVPRGRIRVAEGSWFGVALSAVGITELAIWATPAAAIVAAATLISYVLVYTPLKTRTSLATLVGAVLRLAKSRCPQSYSSASCSSGRCRTSWRSPGCTRTITQVPVFLSCQSWSRMVDEQVVRRFSTRRHSGP